MIGFESEETALRKLRKQLQQMSDDELIAFGKCPRSLAGRRVSGLGDAYRVNLDKARGSGDGDIRETVSLYGRQAVSGA
jgi:hypothetical protein